jgi:hypothetical protein
VLRAEEFGDHFEHGDEHSTHESRDDAYDHHEVPQAITGS